MEDETIQNHDLYSFLGTQSVFTQKLKEKLAQMIDSDKLLIDVANSCASIIENRQYLLPSTKHAILKVLLRFK
jgi:cytoplasmic FMR1 interacting protein